MIVTMQDVRAALGCGPGIIPFARRHGLNVREFLRHGIEAERLLATGDAMAAKIVEAARRRHGRE